MNYDDYWNKEHLKYINSEVISDNWLDKYLNLFKNKDIKILDLGCGLGNNIKYLLNNNYHNIVALDYSKTSIDFINNKYKNVNNILFDITNPLPFKNNEFDLVVADLSLHYFNDETTKKIINEIKRILKDDGLLLGRVNSIEDYNYGINDGIKIEDNFYYVNGYNKRFFNDIDMNKYFSTFKEFHYFKVNINRYSKEKKAYEFICKSK